MKLCRCGNPKCGNQAACTLKIEAMRGMWINLTRNFIDMATVHRMRMKQPVEYLRARRAAVGG